jgi:hypothetical protein
MSHPCKCGQIFFSPKSLSEHQLISDCMLEKFSIVDLHLKAKHVKALEIAEAVRVCHKEIVSAMNKGEFYASVDYAKIPKNASVIKRLRKLFAGIRIRHDKDSNTIDFEWDDVITPEGDLLSAKDDLSVDDFALCAEDYVLPQIFNMDYIQMKTDDLIVKLDRKSVRSDKTWSDIRKVRFIDTIMHGLPIPHIYLLQDDNGFHCLKGKRRLSTIFDYITQNPNDDKEPFAWVIERQKKNTKEEIWNKFIGPGIDDNIYVYYNDTPDMVTYVNKMNDENKQSLYRFMTTDEKTKFVNYLLPLCIIHGNLSDSERDFIQKKLNKEEDISMYKIGGKKHGFGKKFLWRF